MRAGEIHEAAKAGDLAKVRALVAANPAVVNLSEHGGPTPLHLAVAGGHTQVAEFLLASKADPNAKLGDSHNAMMESGFTPMHVAAAKGDVAMGRLLVKHGADVNGVATLTGPPLFVAVGQDKLDFVKFLLENKADPKAVQPAANATLLHVAARLPKTDILHLLLAQKPDVNRPMADGRTPLWIAAEADNVAAAELLIANGANVNVTDREGRSLLRMVRNGDARLGLATLLEKHGAKETAPAYTKLVDAVSAGRAEESNAMLKQNPALVNVAASDLYGETLLHTACGRGDAAMVRLLLAYKADVNARNRRGAQPIHYAASSNIGREQTNVVALLLESKADINARDDQGSTPLHLAVVRLPTLPDADRLIEFLVAKGADVNVKDDDGQTPLQLVLKLGLQDRASLLRKLGAAEPAAAKEPNRAKPVPGVNTYQLGEMARTGNVEKLRQLIQSNPNAVNASLDSLRQDTPLHLAAEGGQQAVVELLLVSGANVNIEDYLQMTPLHKAVERGNAGIVGLLLAAKPDINAKEYRGNRPLHLAAASGNRTVVERLMAAGAAVNVKNQFNQTPMDVALAEGQTEVFALLREHGGRTTPAPWFESLAQEMNYIISSGDTERLPPLLKAHPELLAATNQFGRFALPYAVRFDRRHVVAALLTNKFDANATDERGKTPMQLALSLEMALLLKQHGATGEPPDMVFQRARREAKSGKLKEGVKKVLDEHDAQKAEATARAEAEALAKSEAARRAKAKEMAKASTTSSPKADVASKPGGEKPVPSTTALHDAVRSHQKEVVESLLAQKADLNARDRNGSTPLHVAAVTNDKEMTALLLTAKADANARNNSGGTPLHIAAVRGFDEVVRALVDAGADVNAADNSGTTALHHAVINGKKSTVELLLSRKADPNLRDKKGKSPLQSGVEKKRQDVADLLRASGAKD